jgi:hypothetical protein
MGLALSVLVGNCIRRAWTVKKAKWLIFSILSFFMMAFSSHGLHAKEPSSPHRHGKGLITPTKEEWQQIEKTWHRIVKVRPNKIGVARIKIEREKNGLAPMEIPAAQTHEEEFYFGSKGEEEIGGYLTGLLPSQVDNTLLPSFPPIGDQGEEGSCVAWASTYYQATHEIGLLNGMNNKTSNMNVLSPKWTYNMINGGADTGSFIPDAYALLAQSGATTISKFPYDGNYLQWDVNTQDWITAMSFRTGVAKYIPGLGGGAPQNLAEIKQALNNGHILTVATYADSWVMTTIQANPASANGYVGQQAISWVNGMDGGHFITIVGYDDNVWIDVNGNGQVDPGETGAFLLANSWGTGWGNQGLIWVSYDAFLGTSAVPNGPSLERVPFADGTNSTAVFNTAKAHNYSPSLIAEFSVSQTQRNQMKVSAGISSTMQNSPVKYFGGGMIAYQGGPYAFDGTTAINPESATFAIDLSDLALAYPSDERFYLMVNDNTSGDPTTLNSFTLVDFIHGQTVSYDQVPQSVDNGKITDHIDYTFAQEAAEPKPQSASVALSAPSNGSLIHGIVPVVARVAGGQIDHIDFFVDTKFVSVEKAAPYLVHLDTTKLLNGKHRITIVAQDMTGKQMTASLIVKVQN